MNIGLIPVYGFALAIALLTGPAAPAGDQAAASDEASSVLIRLSIVELSAVPKEAEAERKDTTPSPTKGQAGDDAEANGVEIHTVTEAMQVQMLQDGGRLKVGEHCYVVANARLTPLKENGAKAADPKVIANPSLKVRVGEEAEVMIGQAVSYMEKLENGDLRLVVKDDCVEGVEVQALVSEVKNGLIHLDKLSVTLNTIEGRESIEGVPFDVGRPIVRTQQISCSLEMTKGHTAVVPLLVDRSGGATVVLLIAMQAEVATAAKPS